MMLRFIDEEKKGGNMGYKKSTSKFFGRPMPPSDLIHPHHASELLPNGARIVSIEEARMGLKKVRKYIYTLQNIQEKAQILTEELDMLLRKMDIENPHVEEVSTDLAIVIDQWKNCLDEISSTGCEVKSIDPPLLDWYGVVDGELVNYCWEESDNDVKFWHSLNTGFSGRLPLIED